MQINTVIVLNLTLPKSRTSNRSKASNSSLFFMPKISEHALRNVLMFFKQRNWREEQNTA